MSQGEELDLDFIESLLSQPEPVKRTGTRKPKADIRDINTWFKVDHVSKPCEVKRHEEVAPGRPREKGVTTIINDVAVCRVCFFASADKSQTTDINEQLAI